MAVLVQKQNNIYIPLKKGGQYDFLIKKSLTKAAFISSQTVIKTVKPVILYIHNPIVSTGFDVSWASGTKPQMIRKSWSVSIQYLI